MSDILENINICSFIEYGQSLTHKAYISLEHTFRLFFFFSLLFVGLKLLFLLFLLPVLVCCWTCTPYWDAGACLDALRSAWVRQSHRRAVVMGSYISTQMIMICCYRNKDIHFPPCPCHTHTWWTGGVPNSQTKLWWCWTNAPGYWSGISLTRWLDMGFSQWKLVLELCVGSAYITLEVVFPFMCNGKGYFYSVMKTFQRFCFCIFILSK